MKRARCVAVYRIQQAAMLAMLAAVGCGEDSETTGSTAAATRTTPGDTAALLGQDQPDEDLLPISSDVERQFDFWLGEWDVQNRYLVNGAWQETGQAQALIQSVAGGKAILEQWDGTAQHRLHGFSIRTYDDELKKWVIVLNWHGGSPSGFSQMHGVFSEDRGEFFPPGGGPKGTRFTFSKPRPSSCQWDQANSQNGGQTWETNWIMSFTRREEPTTADASSLPIKQLPESAKSFPKSRLFDGQIGCWSGTAERITDSGEWEQGTVEVAVSSMIEGLGLIRLADYSWDEHAFAALAFDPNRNKWVSVGVDNLQDRFQWCSGMPSDDVVTFSDMRMNAETILQETWSGLSGDAVRVEREVSIDGGRTFSSVLRANLERQIDD
ncbi:MAG: hypothetical protein MPJ50_06410 [Pirellulales bacterium]|nr:hypothetical protein [Pirellulales bacterium]